MYVAETALSPDKKKSALPREGIKLADPELKELICPVTKRPMQPAFVETQEALARRPAVYYVQHYERTVFHQPGQDRAGVCTVAGRRIAAGPG